MYVFAVISSKACVGKTAAPANRVDLSTGCLPTRSLAKPYAK